MSCGCCCAIRQIADTVQIKFGNTQQKQPLFGSPPCFANGALVYCPSAAADVYDNFLLAFYAARDQGKGVNDDAGSGSCSRYDGTYVVDLDNGPSSGDYYWCTALYFAACIGVIRPDGAEYTPGPYPTGNSISYSVGCNSAFARHAKIGNNAGVEYIASLASVIKGGAAPQPPADAIGVSGPDKVASSAVHDWYMTRYSRVFSGGYVAYELWGGSGTCELQMPEITLQ